VKPLDVVLCWHMHQPSYRTADGEYRQPWVYLHAAKDYSDMAWHLERVAGARAVVSFTPVLLDQLDDYAEQFTRGTFSDPLLRALQRGDADTPDARRWLAQAVCRANYWRMVLRFPSYERLFHLAETEARGGPPLSDQDRVDALVWYHLVWLGEGARRTDERVAALMAKARGFDARDRATMLTIVGELVRGIVPRYRALAQSGRIELSTSPYAHPILPLLIDFRAALEAQPAAPLPASHAYPGGAARADVHIRTSRERHAARFGAPPLGCWPSEGGVSDAALAALGANGFAWAASGEAVLANTLRARHIDPGPRERYLYTPYAVHNDAGTLACFFRDDDLSDRVGFVYATWHADDAAANLVSALEGIADATADQPAPIVSIILDGENAWEHYPENAYYFLSALYDRLSTDPKVRLTTYAEHLRRRPTPPGLDHVVAGSWVYGSFVTWIGDEDKNRGWDVLVEAKHAYDRAVASGRLDAAALARAELQLRVCEGSDWFWWFGGYNPHVQVSDFERLFRQHLKDLYEMIGEPIPDRLAEAVSVGAGAPLYDGVMRQSTQGASPT
jgi:alpha-amylase/alpha-mannosidase (GH57 family)